jgi:hypothetical protein
MIGKSLAVGEAADRSLKATFWHPSYPYQPGYAWLSGVMAWIFAGDIVGARFLNTLIALCIALLTYFRVSCVCCTFLPLSYSCHMIRL